MPAALSSFHVLLELDRSTTCFVWPGAIEKTQVPLLEKRMFEISSHLKYSTPPSTDYLNAGTWCPRAGSQLGNQTLRHLSIPEETESTTRQIIFQERLGSPPGEVLRALFLVSSITCPLLWPPESPPAIHTGCTQS